jgi:hypothetical protein
VATIGWASRGTSAPATTQASDDPSTAAVLPPAAALVPPRVGPGAALPPNRWTGALVMGQGEQHARPSMALEAAVLGVCEPYLHGGFPPQPLGARFADAIHLPPQLM